MPTIASRRMPALLTRIWTPPESAASVSVQKRSTAAGSATSSLWTESLPPKRDP